MSNTRPHQDFMTDSELADEIAEMAGIESYDSSRYNSSDRASYIKEERRQIYEALTGESGDELLRTELNYVIMDSIDSELHSAYPYEFTRKDLKEIHKRLSEHQHE